MIITVKAFVELLRSVNCEKELNWKILTFFILHNYRLMRIYNHYSVIKEDKTTFYHHLIYTFDFTVLNGKKK